MAGKRTGAHPKDALTALKVKRLREPGFYPDGGCLYLRVDDNINKRWVVRVAVRGSGKRRNIGLGSADLVSLEEARDQAREYRRDARKGKDPIAERIAQRRAAQPVPTFAELAKQLIENKQAEWRNAKHRAQWPSTLSTYAFPKLGKLPIDMIGTDEVLSAIEPIWAAKPETASRTRQRIEAVLDYATAKGHRTGDNPARWKGHLDHLLAKPSKIRAVKHLGALPWQELPEFMTVLSKRDGVPAKALAFAILAAARSGEIRGMTWGEIDSKNALWIVPANRMKAGKEHRVPLTTQALALLGQRGEPDELVFPNSQGGPLTINSLMNLLRTMDMGHVTAHGFRSTFRDWAGEATHHPREMIEHALAHRLKDQSEAAYARGDLLAKRRALMSDWANYAAGGVGTVTVLHPKGTSAAALRA